MRLSLDTRWLDVALKAVLVLVVVAIGYLAYTVLTGQSRDEEMAAASQTIGDLITSIEQNPNDLRLRLELAQAYGAAGQFDDAIEQFEVVLQLDANNPDALTGLGLIAMFEGEWESAEGHWRSVINEIGAGQYAGVDQRLAVAYHQLGATLIERGRYREATEYLLEALRISPHAADSHYALAVAYRELDAVARQRKHLEDALMFDPVMPEANYEYGLLLLAGRYRGRRRALPHVGRQRPGGPHGTRRRTGRPRVLRGAALGGEAAGRDRRGRRPGRGSRGPRSRPRPPGGGEAGRPALPAHRRPGVGRGGLAAGARPMAR
ncbi:MAG: tetratricopeptide repeat protein [Actinomycetota bacterium]|nr:MAG: tetratricopeptide repeat protein [Actinomycetota bacterium]